MNSTRRDWLKRMILGSASLGLLDSSNTAAAESRRSADTAAPLTITGMKITPIALPDPPILAASGCHGPYFLRTIVELETDAGIVGIAETKGGEARLTALKRARELVVGKNAFAYRRFAKELIALDPAAYAGVELACLDACGRATGRRLCELLGGPVREEVEFAAYLFYRFASDHPTVLADSRIVDQRGRGERALDVWGEVRSAETMAEMAVGFQRKWGFRAFKLKAGVLDPAEELATIRAMNERFEGKNPLRIDPNGRWRVETAVRIGKELQNVPLEYYEDPVRGQTEMAEVRRRTGLTMSTNSCVVRFDQIPSAIRLQPIDVVLADHHYWGGMIGCQALGKICETLGWSVNQHSNNHAGITMAAMAHLGAVVPQLTLASDTHYVWLVEGADIIDGPNIPIRGGQVKVPTGPGVGVEIDRDKLARAHEVYQKCGMRRRDDATMMQRMVPGWQRTLF